MGALWQDVKFGLRMLRKNPGLTATAVATLALAIGANTAVFSVLDPLLLRKLPCRFICLESDDLMFWDFRPGLGRDVVPLAHESF